MRRRNWQAVLSGSVLLLSSCSDVTTPRTLEFNAAHTAVASAPDVATAEAELARVARATAVALGTADARLAVRNAMRDSPWNEHKVSFQEFIASEVGRPFLAAAASASGESAEEFTSRADALPLLDFYVPSAADRKTWRGTQDVVIEASLNFERWTVFRFTPDGERTSKEAADQAGTVMLLHPMELRARRLDPQPLGEGDVIQAQNDGQEAYTVRWVGADGTVFLPDFESLKAQHTRDTANFGGPSLTSVASSSSTRLGCISINDWDDAGNNEVVLKVRFYEPDGTFRGYAEWSYTEFEPNTTRCPGTDLLNEVMPDSTHNGGQAYINVDVWEDDCGCFGNDDDHIGARDFFYYDNDQTRDVPVSPLIHDWRATMDLEWVARSPSTLTSVSVSNLWIYENQGAYGSARPLDQYGYGLPGYSVSGWSTRGQLDSDCGLQRLGDRSLDGDDHPLWYDRRRHREWNGHCGVRSEW